MEKPVITMSLMGLTLKRWQMYCVASDETGDICIKINTERQYFKHRSATKAISQTLKKSMV